MHIRPETTCFRLKTDQTRRFNLWECAASRCVWKHPEWIFSILFLYFYEGPDRFWVLFLFFCLLTAALRFCGFLSFFCIFQHFPLRCCRIVDLSPLACVRHVLDNKRGIIIANKQIYRCGENKHWEAGDDSWEWRENKTLSERERKRRKQRA